MLIISSREFRDHQKKYFDLVDNNEQVVVQRGKNKAYIVIPVRDTDRLSVNPELIKIVIEAEKEAAEGKGIKIKDPQNIWDDIL